MLLLLILLRIITNTIQRTIFEIHKVMGTEQKGTHRMCEILCVEKDSATEDLGCQVLK